MVGEAAGELLLGSTVAFKTARAAMVGTELSASRLQSYLCYPTDTCYLLRGAYSARSFLDENALSGHKLLCFIVALATLEAAARIVSGS